MLNLYDFAYWAVLAGSSPYWLLKKSARAKVLRAFQERMGEVEPREGNAPAIWIHAVSLGEMNATRCLIDALRQARPEVRFIVSTTTRTGYERGRHLYGELDFVQLVRFPLDFSSAIQRMLDRLRPDLVVLMELEIWPNFVRHCFKRRIPVMIANGRITEPSYRKYMWVKLVTARMMRRIECVCVQDETYAKRFINMGATPGSVRLVGTMKFDNARIEDEVAGSRELACDVGLKTGDEFIWVCGSTGPGEEQIVLGVYRELAEQYPRLRLAIIPRHPERFDEVAELIAQFGFNLVRRSRPEQRDAPKNGTPPVILGDTMGELRKFYSLADVVFVGRSLVDLGPRQHGSDMIEPAALAKPVIVGPYTANFAEAVRKFRLDSALIEVPDAATLRQAMAVLLAGPNDARATGRRAQEIVRREQGSTLRHADEILALLKK